MKCIEEGKVDIFFFATRAGDYIFIILARELAICR